MPYIKTNWQDLPSIQTPITANNLNNIENGIEEAMQSVEETNDKIGNLSNLKTADKSSIVNAINTTIDAEVYSTSEVKTNKIWINGKPIYRKVINCGNLPNNTGIAIPHGITNLEQFTSVIGTANHRTTKEVFPLPYITLNQNNSGAVNIFVSTTQISLNTNTDRSSYVAYVTLEYTKTTD